MDLPWCACGTAAASRGFRKKLQTRLDLASQRGGRGESGCEIDISSDLWGSRLRKLPMPRTYFDSGALVKLYIVEPGSGFVQAKALAASAIPLNQLQETETRNAIHAAMGRKMISAEAGKRALEHLDYDIRAGVFALESPDWSPIWSRAAHLARLHTQRLLCRTLDILHVAAAESCGAVYFVTGDVRQFKLSKAVGLPAKLVPTK